MRSEALFALESGPLISKRQEIRRVARDFHHALIDWQVWSTLAVRDFKLRFRRSVVGPIWIFLNFFLTFAALGLVYGNLFGQEVEHFLPFLAAGLVLWNFVLSSFTEGAGSFVAAEPYIRQFAIPKQAYILRTGLFVLMVFGIGMTNVLVVMLAFKTPVGLGTLYALPGVLLLELIVLAHVWIMSYLCVPIRDLAYGVSTLLSIAFYVTPIIYTTEMLDAHGLSAVYYCNPFHYLIELVRYPLLHAAAAPAEIYLGATIYFVAVWTIAIAIAATLDREIPQLL